MEPQWTLQMALKLAAMTTRQKAPKLMKRKRQKTRQTQRLVSVALEPSPSLEVHFLALNLRLKHLEAALQWPR